jgi:hypothetical protein
MISISDDDIVRRALSLASAADAGQPADETELAKLKVIASTRDTKKRHELEREARARNQALGESGLQVLRVALAIA